MKALFHRLRLRLLTMLVVSLPFPAAQAAGGMNLKFQEYSNEVFVVQVNELAGSNRTVKSVLQSPNGPGAGVRQPIALPKIAGSDNARSILERVDTPAKSANSILVRPASTKGVAARQVSSVKAVKPTAKLIIAESIEFDRFSTKDFAASGFSPQCMFADQSASHFYLESRIAGTLAKQSSSVYALDRHEWIEPEKSDSYWQYYSDCDNWGVVFTEFQLPRIEEQKSSSIALRVEVVSTIRNLASLVGSKVYQFARHAEFYATEVPQKLAKPSVQEKVVEGLKSARPIILNVIDNDVVRSARDLSERFAVNRKMMMGMLSKAWNRCTEGKSLLSSGPVESNALAPQRMDKNSRR